MSARSGSLVRICLALFVWSSALTVALCGILAATGAQVSLLHARTSGESIGLTYTTRPLALLALAEVVLVLLAWGWTRSARSARRRTGAWMLVAWAALWTANAVRWASAAPESMSIGIAVGLGLALVCALSVALRREPAS